MKRLLGLVILTGLVMVQTGCQKGSAEPAVLQNTRPYTPRATLAPQTPVTLRDDSTISPAPLASVFNPPMTSKSPAIKQSPKEKESDQPTVKETKKETDSTKPLNDKKSEITLVDSTEEEVTPAPNMQAGGFGGNRFNSSSSKFQFKKTTVPSNMPSWFTEWDADGDGMVMLHECPKDKREEFRKYDLNGDGIITIEEAERTLPKQPKVVASTTSTTTTTPAPSTTTTPAPVASTTTSSSSTPATGEVDEETLRSAERTLERFGGKKSPGKMAPDELPWFLASMKERFAEFDTDKDNYLNKTELAHLLKASRNNNRREFRGGPPGGGDNGMGGGGRGEFGRGNGGRGEFGRGTGDNGMGGGGRGEFGRGGGGGGGNGYSSNPDEMNKRMFDRLNKKGDGKLTRDEWPSFWPKERFDEYDTNKDSVVNFEEFKAGMAKRFQRSGR